MVKIIPQARQQSKEDLYAKVIVHKIEANQLRIENQKLQTRLTYYQTKLSRMDATGQSSVVLKQLQE